MMDSNKKSPKHQAQIPAGLKYSFILHFVIDMLFALPMFFAPTWFFEVFGLGKPDLMITRLVAAALFGIGIESLIGRNASLETFQNMLNLKIIFSATASIGIALSLYQMSKPIIWVHWLIWGTFVAFNILWVYWKVTLKKNN